MGANLPWRGQSPKRTVVQAIKALSELGEMVVRSGLWASPAWPDPGDPPYVNAVVRVTTRRAPGEFLEAMQAIERAHGRAPGPRNAPRALDLDVIDWDGRVLEEPGLAAPHPRAHERAFVLLPLREAAPLWTHPTLGETADGLLARLPAPARMAVKRIRRPRPA